MSELLASYSDTELINLYQKKQNAECVGELYKRYSMLVFGLSLKYLKNEEDAKDAVIEIFEYLIEKLKTAEVSFFKSWLFSVSKNELLKKIIKNKQHITNELDEELKNSSEKFMENETELSLNIEEDKNDLLQKAISNLPEEQKTCIDLFYYKQKTYQEVASITGYDLNKVKSAIQNGKRNLKLFMEEKQTNNGQRNY